MKTRHTLLMATLAIGLNATAAELVRVPVTDPAVLADFGLPADATTVWRLVDPNPQPKSESRAQLGSPPAIDGHSYSVVGSDFHMYSSNAPYETDGNTHLYCPTGSIGDIAQAVVHVPEDHRIQFLDVWAHDSSTTTTVTAYLFSSCMSDDFSTNPPSQTILAQVEIDGGTGSGTPGDVFQFDNVVTGYFADPEHCTYMINLALADGAANCQGPDLKLYKARVVWDTGD